MIEFHPDPGGYSFGTTKCSVPIEIVTLSLMCDRGHFPTFIASQNDQVRRDKGEYFYYKESIE